MTTSSIRSRVRRPKGMPTVGIQLYIEPAVKELLDRYVAISGMPQWAVIEAALRAGVPDPATGLPPNWDLSMPTKSQPQLLDAERRSA